MMRASLVLSRSSNILQDAELDGATVPILYEGRTADGIVKDAPSLDAVFEDLFRDYTPEELAVIKAKYATEGDVMEAPMLIEQKACDMIRHFASVVLPEGYKAQVVATSRQACITYLEKLEQVNIIVELPKLLDRRARAVAVFTDLGVTDLQGQVDVCVQLLEDLKIRADFINKLRSFYEMLGLLEHRPEVPGDVFRDAKLLGFINKVAANLYRDPALNLFGVAEKVKSLINAHISARGVDPKIPPTAITDAEFEKVLQAAGSSRARAAQMQHAARYYIIGFSNQNPAYARKMSERLEEILQRFKDDWNVLERELRKFIDELRQGDRNDFPDLDAKVQVPFVRLVLEECSKGRELTDDQRKTALTSTLEMVDRIRQEVRKVGFWKNEAMRELLTRALVRDLNRAGVCRPGGERDLAQRLVALAKENHENLTPT
jgi:type I restriction enzyme, R subunit